MLVIACWAVRKSWIYSNTSCTLDSNPSSTNFLQCCFHSINFSPSLSCIKQSNSSVTMDGFQYGETHNRAKSCPHHTPLLLLSLQGTTIIYLKIAVRELRSYCYALSGIGSSWAAYCLVPPLGSVWLLSVARECRKFPGFRICSPYISLALQSLLSGNVFDFMSQLIFSSDRDQRNKSLSLSNLNI